MRGFTAEANECGLLRAASVDSGVHGGAGDAAEVIMELLVWFDGQDFIRENDRVWPGRPVVAVDDSEGREGCG